jgi:two-component system, OmpR family, response regulator
MIVQRRLPAQARAGRLTGRQREGRHVHIKLAWNSHLSCGMRCWDGRRGEAKRGEARAMAEAVAGEAGGADGFGRAGAGSLGELLVVDDEIFLCEAVAASLRFLGYSVTTAQSGTAALRLARDRMFDLVVLDVMLPDVDGFSVVTRLRRSGSRVPVIFLTARDTRADKVQGLTLGGDDYLTKPFGLEELAARIGTVLRRTRPGGPGGGAGAVLSFADVELDQDAYQVRRAGRPITLSPTEFRLLRYFLLNPGRVLTRTQLLDHVWDYDFGGSGTVVSTYVAYLRRKLSAHGPQLIHTQRGIGYILRLPVPGETETRGAQAGSWDASGGRDELAGGDGG